jgi:hypothetical protein
MEDSRSSFIANVRSCRDPNLNSEANPSSCVFFASCPPRRNLSFSLDYRSPRDACSIRAVHEDFGGRHEASRAHPARTDSAIDSLERVVHLNPMHAPAYTTSTKTADKPLHPPKHHIRRPFPPRNSPRQIHRPPLRSPR